MIADVLAGLHIHERQSAAIPPLSQQHRTLTGESQQASGASPATAMRDLGNLVAKRLPVPAGAGHGASCELLRKRLENGSIGSSWPDEPRGSGTARRARQREETAGGRLALRPKRSKK